MLTGCGARAETSRSLMCRCLLLLLLAAGDAQQSPTQSSASRRIALAAAPASAQALPILRQLDDPAFRGNLSACCPDLSTLTAAQLWARFQAELETVELIHSFPADASLGGTDNVVAST